MDPYDAIVEQLRKAQQRGMEAVTNRLDFVLESLEGLLQEAKESVQEAIPSDAEELFPVAEAAGALVQAKEAASNLQAQIEELTSRVEELEDRGPEGVSLDLLRTMDAARSQSELLRKLLPMLLEHVGRAAVLVLRDGTISAWSGIGFADGERLRAWRCATVDAEPFRRLADEGVAVRFAPAGDPVIGQWMEGEVQPAEAIIVPVSLRGRIVGGVYMDRLEGGPWEPETAQALVALTCWLIDTLSFRTVVPSPTLTEPAWVGGEAVVAAPEEEEAAVAEAEAEAGAEAQAEAEAEVEAEAQAGVEAEAEVEPEAEEEAAPEEEAAEAEVTPAEGYPPVTEEAAGAAPEAEAAEEEPEAAPREEELAAAEGVAEEATQEPSEPAGEEEEAAPPEFNPSATLRVDPGPAIAEARADMDSAATIVGDTAMSPPALEPPPVQPVVPPPPVQPVVPPPPVEEEEGEELGPDEEAEHEEARRFARLLVSEIKLYNPEEVERGRQGHDLYRRLREDVDRSREMYEKRVTEGVRAARDYFHEELVRILADGDEEALGM